ncbi:MAG: maltose ABC transporter permease MalG [Succinivibrio sp.]
MAIVQPKSLVYRKALAHVFILAFLCLIMFPLLMIVAISFRQGNFSVGDVIPKASTSTLDHWRLALGFNVRKLNKVSGSVINVINTDDGKVRMYITSDEDVSFRNFVTEPFSMGDVKSLKGGDILTVQANPDTSEIEDAYFVRANESKDFCLPLVGKLAMQLGDGAEAVTYFVDKNDNEGTNFGVYKESIIPPPFPVLLWLWNSIKVAFITAFLIICLSTTSAYAFARMKFKGKTAILNGMLIFQMFPAVLALVAIYALFDKIGDYIPWLGLNTHGGLILSYMGGIALHIWTIKGYFETIDASLEEAAAIDGATPWQAFRLILLPLSVPILAVVFILAFIGTITEVPVASVLLLDMNALTLAVGSQQYLYPQNYLWGDFAAAAVLSGLPITIVFLLAQRWLVGGLTAGGVKG